MRTWTSIALGLLSLVFIGIGIFMLTRRGGDDNQINVYFFNPIAMQMEAEARSLPVGDSQLQEVVMYLYTGPRARALNTTWPTEIAPDLEDLISAVKLEGATLYAFFTPVFHEIAPLNQSLFKAAFIHTLGGVPSVSDMIILVTDDYNHAFDVIMRSLDEDYVSTQDYDEDYEPYIPLVIFDSSHAGVLLNPLDPPISPQFINDRTFNHLHFVDYTGTGLVIESYNAVGINMQPTRLGRHALELLIDGPRQEGAISLIPQETRILDIEIDHALDIYVNLSIDFVNRFVGSTEQARLMIYSIVNTLIWELPSPLNSRVHFLIEAQQLEEFHGIVDFHTAFTLNNTVLLSYIEALAEEQAGYAYDFEVIAE